MEPEIPDGALMLVNVERRPQVGEPVLIRIGAETLCKALVAVNGLWVLHARRRARGAVAPGR
jgi:phage repressor protein C with HTH and peptisase S24 domain